MAYTELLKRIDQKLAENGLSERKACLNAGLKVDAVRTIRRGNAPRAETLTALARVLNVSPSYLLDAAKSDVNQDSDDVRQMISIQEVDVRAGMGGGYSIDYDLESDGGNLVDRVKPVSQWSVPADMARGVTQAPAEQLKFITVIGNSMTPDLLPGQRVLVDLTDRAPSPPGVFVVWDGLSLVVKIVEFIPFSDPPAVRIKSKNPDYETYERTLDEAYIQGRVVGKWQWT